MLTRGSLGSAFHLCSRVGTKRLQNRALSSLGSASSRLSSSSASASASSRWIASASIIGLGAFSYYITQPIKLEDKETVVGEEPRKEESTDGKKADHASEGKDGEQKAAYNPETGEINWDCPCLGGMADGPCGEEFKAAFSCFVYSEAEPKGFDCVEKFKFMQECFRKYPEVYSEEIRDDERTPIEDNDTKDQAETISENATSLTDSPDLLSETVEVTIDLPSNTDEPIIVEEITSNSKSTSN